MRRALLLTLTISILPGCGETDSSELATNAIKASIELVVSEENDTEATVFLKDGFSHVVLSEGDRLTLTTDRDAERDFVMNSSNFYELGFSDDATEGTVALLRTTGQSAPSSTASIPEALALDPPLAGTTVSLGAGELTVAWTNPAAGATIDVWTEECGTFSGGVGLFPEDPADTGSITIDPSELGTAGQCISLIVTRTVPGSIDPAFAADSDIIGAREERIDLTLAP